MKKFMCVILITIKLALFLSTSVGFHGSFAENSAPNEKISDIDYSLLFNRAFSEHNIWRFGSIKALYEGLIRLPIDTLEYFREIESRYLEDTRRIMTISKSEEEHGIFGNFRIRLTRGDTQIFPHFQERLSARYVGLDIGLNVRRPSIKYFCMTSGFWVEIMFFDPELAEEANIRGASWLLSQIAPNRRNASNYREFNQAMIEQTTDIRDTIILEKMEVYEQKYRLGERDVLTMVVDNSRLDSDIGSPSLTVYFVYDDMLVNMTGGEWALGCPGDSLSNLVFREVCLHTGMTVETEPPPEWQSPFTDLSPDAWYFKAIAFMNQQGIMSGHADGRIGAEEILTRAQFATLLWVIENRPEPSNSSYYNFTDVQPEHWHYNAVTWAAENSIVSGVGDGRFNPDAPVSRQQVLQMLYNYAANFKGIEIPQVQDLPNFSDFGEVSDWAESAVTTLAKAGVMNGLPDEGLLKPRDDTTRGEAAWVLMNFMRLK